MNSNTHHRSLNNSTLFNSPLTIYTHIIPHITNPIYNPTIADVYNYTKPLSFEKEPYSLETIPLIREHLDTYLFYIRHRSTTISTEYPAFQITFPQQETSSTQTYRRTINPINLQVHIKDVFHAFLSQVKKFNLSLEIPKFSPNALQELERYIHNFEVEDIKRIVII